MHLLDAIQERHSVRRYTDKKIEGAVEKELRLSIAECNQRSGLHIQLCLNEPKAFSGRLAHYGKFSNAHNYITLVGKKSKHLDEACGYYGEKIAIKAQQLGLNTCWVALSYSKGQCACTLEKGETLRCVISIGYGESPGTDHKTKPLEKLCRVEGPMPEWFRQGVEAASLAPTAMNQQKFCFSLRGSTVTAVTALGFYAKIDLGIAKYHFEIGAGEDGWLWA